MKPSIWISIFVIIVIALGIYVYTAAPKTVVAPPTATSTTALSFYCQDGKTIQAQFATDSVSLSLSDGRTLDIPQTVSGSGVRYESTTTGADILFSGKGDYMTLSEGGATTYGPCVAAHVSASDAPGYNTYANQAQTFTFAYPTNFVIGAADASYTPGWSAQATTSGLILATIEVPKTVQSGTNFGDAKFTVGTSADPSAVALCTTNPAGSRGTATTTSIGGIAMEKLTFSDAAAGNRYDTTSYRFVQDNQCYAVEYTIHYGVLENYPKGSVKAFDEKGLTASLDEMAQSFRFTGS